MIYFTEDYLVAHARKLGRSLAADSIGELAALSISRSPRVRSAVAASIGRLAGVLSSRQALGLLGNLRDDPHPQVRKSTAKAMRAYA